jgi:hypothetical protein
MVVVVEGPVLDMRIVCDVKSENNGREGSANFLTYLHPMVKSYLLRLTQKVKYITLPLGGGFGHAHLWWWGDYILLLRAI